MQTRIRARRVCYPRARGYFVPVAILTVPPFFSEIKLFVLVVMLCAGLLSCLSMRLPAEDRFCLIYELNNLNIT
jgi:hypothetical protein